MFNIGQTNYDLLSDSLSDLLGGLGKKQKQKKWLAVDWIMADEPWSSTPHPRPSTPVSHSSGAFHGAFWHMAQQHNALMPQNGTRSLRFHAALHCLKSWKQTGEGSCEGRVR